MASWIEDPGLDTWRGLKLSDLSVDQAYINVTSYVSKKLWLYTLSDDCVRCPFYRYGELKSGSVLKFSTKRSLQFRVLGDGGADVVSVRNTTGRVCADINAELGEFGVYDLLFEPGEKSPVECTFNTSRDPVSIHLPLISIALGLLVIAILATFTTYGIKRLIHYCRERKSKNKSYEMSDYGGDDRTTQVSAKPARQRIRSLDTFRGLAIVIMIFVNDGAGGYWFLEHATWDGLYIADCVFPWFMWIMGVCIPISLRSQLKRSTPRWKILRGVIKRAVILFGLGLMLNTAGAGPDLEKIRIPGVLQRFSVSYFIVATLGLCFTPRTSSPDNRFSGSTVSKLFGDITVLLPQWVVVLSLLAAHTYFVYFYPVPGCPSGYLGPGGIQDGKEFFDCVGGMTGYVDRLVLGVNHIYQYPTSGEVFKSGPFDPEGILGVITSVFQVFIGVQAGSIILHHLTWRQRIIRWFIWGTICAIMALILALPDIIPINKNLWSLSFVFTTSAGAFYLLSIIYIIQDHFHLWNGVPFKAPGMNPTILYVGHSIAYDLFPFHWRYGDMNTHFILTIETLWGVSLWVLIAYWLYYVEFFLSI